MKIYKIIIDTNLWVSFLISKNLNQLDKLIQTKRLKIIFSEELLTEFIDVVSRPKFKKYFPKKDIENILHYFDDYGELVQVISEVQICRDKKDDFLLNLSLDSDADYLITGDNDLLILKQIGNTKVINIQDFINQLENND